MPAKTKFVNKSPIVMSVPVVPMTGYIGRRIDIRMSPAEAVAMRCAFDGLRDQNVNLDNGKYIETVPDVLRWMAQGLFKEMYGVIDPRLVTPAVWV